MSESHSESYVLLEVSESAYEEIKGEIIKAGQQDRLKDNPTDPQRPHILMNGIALASPIEMRPSDE